MHNAIHAGGFAIWQGEHLFIWVEWDGLSFRDGIELSQCVCFTVS